MLYNFNIKIRLQCDTLMVMTFKCRYNLLDIPVKQCIVKNPQAKESIKIDFLYTVYFA